MEAMGTSKDERQVNYETTKVRLGSGAEYDVKNGRDAGGADRAQIPSGHGSITYGEPSQRQAVILPTSAGTMTGIFEIQYARIAISNSKCIL